MAEYETAQAAGFKDRKTRLVVFGILQIIFGGLCTLLVPLVILGMIMSATVNKGNAAAGASLRMMIPGILIYLLLAVWFIWMGIGSIRTRRWARALILISSWLWLITGVLGGVFMLVLLPARYDQMGESGPDSYFSQRGGCHYEVRDDGVYGRVLCYHSGSACPGL